jgi:hypothetical protein
MRIRAQVDARKGTDAFKHARRDINARTRTGLVSAGEKVALPAARRGASRLKVAGASVADSLVAKGTTRSAYITSSLRGTKGRAVGLQEYGGRVDSIILPRAKRRTKTGRPPALMGTRFAHPVGRITKARHYPARGRMTRAIQAQEPQIQDAVMQETMKAFDPLQHTP